MKLNRINDYTAIAALTLIVAAVVLAASPVPAPATAQTIEPPETGNRCMICVWECMEWECPGSPTCAEQCYQRCVDKAMCAE